MITVQPDSYLAEDARVRGWVAEALRPRRRVRPSEWARSNIRLSAAESPQPGPYDPDYLPWLADLLDLEFDEPHFKGMIGLKGSQIGWSILQLVLVCWAADTDGGPQLYMIGDASQGKHFASERFLPIARSSESIAAKLRDTGDRRVLVDSIPVGADARADFAGAGTVAGFISRPYRRVVGDEIQLILTNFPAEYGDPVNLMIGRTERYRLSSWVSLFGHPKLKGDRLDKLFETLSDQREWVWDCPHCGGAVRLTGMDQVHFEGVEEGGDPDAARAVLRCPCCGEVITDGQRRRAVQPPRLGGSGRFESQIPAAEAAGKSFIGVRVHGLCDPHKSVAGVARAYLNCPGDEERQGFFNAILGWPYQKSSAAVTVRDIDALVERSKSLTILPGPRVRGGVKAVVVGADVQAPKDAPTYYATPLAALSTGVIVVLDWWLIGGAASDAGLLDAVGRLELPVSGPGGGRDGVVRVGTLAVDDRYNTGHVLDLCRNSVFRPDGAMVRLIPVGYQARMTDDEVPWQRVTKDSRVIDPSRPHLGRLERYELRRHCWVDRVMRMIGEGRILFLKPPDAKVRAQLTSNVLQPKKQLHTWEPVRDEWMLPKGLRDDWLQAIAYGLAALVILHRFDAIHELELAEADRERRPPPPRDDRPTEWVPPSVGDDWLG